MSSLASPTFGKQHNAVSHLSLEVMRLTKESPYKKKFDYLLEQARIGALRSDNSILREMQGKDNLEEVRAVLNEIAPKIKQV